MGRECSSCHEWLSNSNYSYNQWRKGDGWSRCKDCVNGNGGGSSAGYTTGYTGLCYAVSQPQYQCGTCHRTFSNQNELNMHMQVHRPKNVSCPVCGETRFKSGANAVQHVESGYCRGCTGKENARQQIYNFASRQNEMNSYITSNPMITNGNYSNGPVPDFPYQCPQCNKKFRNLSQLMQHQDQKHNNLRILGY